MVSFASPGVADAAGVLAVVSAVGASAVGWLPPQDANMSAMGNASKRIFFMGIELFSNKTKEAQYCLSEHDLSQEIEFNISFF
jgi:hypothetical protein